MRLHDFFDYRVRTRPDDELISYEGKSISAGEAGRLVDRMVASIESSAPQPGSRVAVIAKNSPELLLLFFASAKAGRVLVPINYRLAPEEWAFIVEDAETEILIAEPEFTEQIDNSSLGAAGSLRRVALGEAGPGWESWKAWLDSGRAPRGERTWVSPDSPVYQMYTSGTTGRPKGAVISHSAVLANIVQEGPVFDLQAKDRALVATPLFHAAGSILAFSTLATDGSVVIHREFDAARVVDSLDSQWIAVTLLVPAMIQFCLDVPGVAERGFESLRRIAYGASPISSTTLRDAMGAFSCEFAQGYGLTEATSLVTALLPEDHERALDSRPELLESCGRAAVGTEVRIVDEDGRPLPPGEIGEILVRGPQVFLEYWKRPEETGRVRRDGWLWTGDGGYIDEEGYLFLKDRIKDMIISGGENVYPREIEDVLFSHPAVSDVSVVGVPDDRWGEVALACVVRGGDDEVDEHSLIEFCKGKLAGFKRPRRIEFVAELPRNAAGKVLKRELRERFR